MHKEINVTPLIDVMLVLLIIFMVMSPLSQTGLDVTLPEMATEKDAEEQRLSTPQPLVVEIDAAGTVTLNREKVARDELPLRLRDVLDARSDKSLFLKAHETLRYAEVVAVLDVARGSGAERVGIVPGTRND